MSKKISILVPKVPEQPEFKVIWNFAVIRNIREKILKKCLDDFSETSFLLVYFSTIILNDNLLSINIRDRFYSSWNNLEKQDKSYYISVIYTRVQDYLDLQNKSNEEEKLAQQTLLLERISRDLLLKMERITYWIN